MMYQKAISTRPLRKAVAFLLVLGLLLSGMVPIPSYADSLTPPSYTAPDISSEGDGVVLFGNATTQATGTNDYGDASTYTNGIDAVYLIDSDVSGAEYKVLSASEWSITTNAYISTTVYNPTTSKTSSTKIYGPTMTISYKEFQEELIKGATHNYTIKIVEDGYTDLEIPIRVIARAANDLVIRVFDSSSASTPSAVKVLTMSELQAMQTSDPVYYTLYCGMAGPGYSKAKGVYLDDLFSTALSGTGYAFDAGDTMKVRTTDYLYDDEYKLKTKSAYDKALGDLTALTQTRYYNYYETYEELYGVDRYYFPGYFDAYQSMLSAGTINTSVTTGTSANKPTDGWSAYLTNSLSMEDPVKVEPMLAISSGQRVQDASMAGTEEFPGRGGSLTSLASMGMNRNDAYRLFFGQGLQSSTYGAVQISTTTTRFKITYNIFGIDIIKGAAPTSQTPPALTVGAITGSGVKVTYTDGDSKCYTNQITGVYVNDTKLDDSQYDLSIGNLIIEDSAVSAGAATVKVTATGFSDSTVSFTMPTKWTSFDAYSDHSGTVVTSGGVGLDDMQFHVTTHFNGPVAIVNANSLLNELSVKVAGVTLTSGAVSADYSTKYAEVAVGADGKSLDFTLHVGYAPTNGLVKITAPAIGLTQLTDSSGSAVVWNDISFYMPNGVKLTTTSQTAADPDNGVKASVTKQVVAPSSSTRAMVHMLFLKNGEPVGSLNSYGANLTCHYHNYLALNAESFNALIPGYFTSKFTSGYSITTNGALVTITSTDSGIKGDVLDLRIFAYPCDRDTKADMTALDSYISQASAYSSSGYTAASYNTLQNELYISEAMSNSVYYLQSDVDAQAVVLKNAINSLTASSSGSSHHSSSSSSSSSSDTTNAVTATANSSGKATITAATLKTASSVEISGTVDMTLNAAAIEAIGVSNDLAVSVVKVDNSTLSAELQEKLGDRPVYDIDITSGGKAVTDLGDGKLQISIPYTLAEGESADSIVVYYLADDGTVKEMSGAYYDSATKTVKFTTNHLSRYAVGYEATSGFSDVPSSHWAAESIAYLVGKNIISGRTESTFAPSEKITRAEFVKMLALMSGSELEAGTSSAFSDVAANAWYASYVNWAYSAGIATKSDEVSNFNPSASITRQEMATMIARYVENVKKTTLPSTNEAVIFADNDQIAAYAADSVAMMQKAGIINGKGDNQFAPLDNATRAEAAKMVASLMKMIDL